MFTDLSHEYVPGDEFKFILWKWHSEYILLHVKEIEVEDRRMHI